MQPVDLQPEGVDGLSELSVVRNDDVYPKTELPCSSNNSESEMETDLESVDDGKLDDLLEDEGRFSE